MVNSTQYQYIVLCRANFSQERCPFIQPEGWNLESDDVEIMTEFVFREKLKNKKKYARVDMFPDCPFDEDEEDEETDDDKQNELRKIYTKDSKDDEEEVLDDSEHLNKKGN